MLAARYLPPIADDVKRHMSHGKKKKREDKQPFTTTYRMLLQSAGGERSPVHECDLVYAERQDGGIAKASSKKKYSQLNHVLLSGTILSPVFISASCLLSRDAGGEQGAQD